MSHYTTDQYSVVFDASVVGEDECFVDEYLDEVKEASKLLFSYIF